jgi:hypothetical protein
MFKYSVSIKKVSGRLNESVLPNKNLTVKSKTELNEEAVFNEAAKYLMENYSLELESADVAPMGDASSDSNFFDQLRQRIDDHVTTKRSAWGRGLDAYCMMMVDHLEEYNGGEAPTSLKEFKAWLLNGARDWKQASEGGQWLITDEEIAKRLCSPGELRKVAGGRRQPNPNETWLDVQARALQQAAGFVIDHARRIKNWER